MGEKSCPIRAPLFGYIHRSHEHTQHIIKCPWVPVVGEYHVELDCQIKDNRQLHVLLLRGRQLVAADHNGLSDPFVKLSFGGQRRSSSIKKRTLEPEWNERFVFAVHDASSMVQVECFDHDLLQNDPLGTAQIGVDELAENQGHHITLKLRNVASGELD